jgi:hypothetical protein
MEIISSEISKTQSNNSKKNGKNSKKKEETKLSNGKKRK